MRATMVGLLVLAFGCGGGVALDEAGDTYGVAVCAKSFECCSADELAGHDQEECETSVAMAFSFSKQIIETGADKGRLAYHGDQMQACIEAIESTPCAAWPLDVDREPSCAAVVEPLVPLNGTCDSSDECIDGYCKGAVSGLLGEEPIEGQCTSFIPLGNTCDWVSDDVCAAGAYCSMSDVCTPQLATGDACSDYSACPSETCGVADGASYTTCLPAEGVCYQGCAAAHGAGALPLVGALLFALGAVVARRRR